MLFFSFIDTVIFSQDNRHILSYYDRLDESLVEDPELNQRVFPGNIVAVRNIEDHTHIMFCVLRQA